MSQINAAAPDNLHRLAPLLPADQSVDELTLALKAAAAAPTRPDNDDIFAHILPDGSTEAFELMKDIRDSYRQNLLSDVLAPEKSAQRLAALRSEMGVQNVDAFLVPLNDEFHGEAAPSASERLKWLTGFTGSAGMAVVAQQQAAIFVDGRYTLQVRNEVDEALFIPRHVSDEPLFEWVAENMTAGQKLAYDPWLHTETAVRQLRNKAKSLGIELVALSANPIDAVWENRPPEPLALVVPHEDVFSGESSANKRQRISNFLSNADLDASVHTLPDVIAWLLNIRGADLPSTPFALGFAILHQDSSVDLYMPLEKLSRDLASHLGNMVRIHDRTEFPTGLDSLSNKSVLIDPATTSEWITQRLGQANAQVLRGDDPCMLAKAVKNQTELEGTRSAHIRDGAAISKFLHWLSVTAADGSVDELQAENQLRAFREENEHFKDLSFSTISGAGPNGAIVHYRATEQSNRKLETGNLYLVDSGGQYLDGTTDITRTIAIGQPTTEMKERFTLVLKGHIAIAEAIFPAGTTGSQLDTLARMALWRHGLDYDHGTGHGVGSYLSVHEGPHRISKAPSTVALQAGMIVSNEPGYYKTGAYGIRIENLVAVMDLDELAGSERARRGFETLTYAPIDQNLIDTSLMTPTEINWLNQYHRDVWQKISPLVEGEVKNWLESATVAL